MTCPVIDAASSPASSRTKRAIAPGDEIPCGDSCRSFDLSSSEIHPVSVGPGSTALTVMPHPASSALSVSVSASNRSEEHTSELQSPYDLVCRLLLEKKNT